jgi:CDP-glucose 4,6-dehydratase
MGESFWNAKRVLLTGHTGFKGAWLSAWLTRAGAKLTGFALPAETNPSMYDLISKQLPMTSVLGDLRVMREIEEAVRLADPELVIHMGAQALVRRSYVDPVGTYATNLLGTVNLLDAVRRLSRPEAVLVVTTDKCYENKEWVWPYREDDILGGHDVYSSSKACAEIATASFRRSFYNELGSGLATARAGNVIGGGDWSEDRLLPDLIRSFQGRRPAVIRNPKAVRPWQHVLDALSGYLLLVEQLAGSPREFNQAWNFGPADSDIATVERVANLTAAQWGNDATWTLDETANPHEGHLLKLDATKARIKLGWRPKLDLEKATQWSVDWYRAAAAGSNIGAVTYAQLDAYENLDVGQ